MIVEQEIVSGKARRSACTTLYESVRQQIRGYVRSGQLKPGDRLDETDILAQSLNASKGTVQYSLRKLAEEGLLVRKPRMGTYVSTNAQSLCSDPQVGNMVFVVLPDLKQPEYIGLSTGMQEAANERGIHIACVSANNDLGRYEDIVRRQMKDDGTFGFVIVPPLQGELSLELLLALKERRIPIVACFREIKGGGWPIVGCDDLEICRIAAKHLCDCGCKRIAYLLYESERFANEARYFTFMDTLRDMGVGISQDFKMVICSKGNEQTQDAISSTQQIRDWLSEHADDVDGICCAHDGMAITVIKLLSELGKKVPDDISVIGAGNIAKYYDLAPTSLTTVDVDHHGMGVIAFEMITEMTGGKVFPSYFRVDAKSSLIVGTSTKRRVVS